MSELVSVVIPVYNRASEIGRALESVQVQTYPYWEAIVVDDGSTDGTAELVALYAQVDRRIRLICHEKNRGAQAARNTGIRAAQGKWIAFLDSDDIWLPQSLEMRLGLAKQKMFLVVHSDCYILRPGTIEPELYKVPPMEGRVYKELLRRPGPMFPGLLISKEAIDHIGYLDESIVSFQEWDTAIRFGKYYKFGFIPEPTFIYDCSHKDTISKNALQTAKGYEQVFKKHWLAIIQHLGPRALANHYQRAAFLYHNTNEHRKAHLYLLVAILLWPFQARTILSGLHRLVRVRGSS